MQLRSLAITTANMGLIKSAIDSVVSRGLHSIAGVNPIIKTIVGIFLTLSLLTNSWAAYAVTDDSSIFHFDIPPLEAGDALTAFGQQADITVLYKYNVVKEYRTNQLKGGYELSEALSLLLKNTDLEANFDPAGHLIITKTQRENIVNRQKFLAAAAAFLFSTSTIPGQVSAQTNDEPASTVLEELVVTGSLIRKKTGYEGSSPLTIVNRDLFERQGVADLVDLAGTLTVNAGSIVSQETGNLIGTSQFNIRNLGSGSTLTLINGRRGGISAVADPNGALFFDNKQLPLAMIERIDVQTDGASATYGSDAVGGVVNIITRKGFEGFEFSTRFQDSANDAYSINMASGFKTDKGLFNLYATYYGQTRTHRTDFDWLVERIHGNGDLTQSRLISSTGSPGTYRPVDAPNGTAGPINTLGGNQYIDADCEAALGVIRGGLCRYNFADQVAVLPEESRIQVFSEMEWDFSEKTKFIGEFSFSNNEITRSQGPNGFSNGLVSNGNTYIPADHPFNFWIEDASDPTGETLTYIDPSLWDNSIHQAVDLACRCRPQGAEANGSGDSAPFNKLINIDYARTMFGIEHELNNSWSLSANYMYANATRTLEEENNWNSITLNQSVLDGTFNPFGTSRAFPDLVSPKDGTSLAGNSDDIILYIMNIEKSRQESTQQVFEILATGDLFEMGGQTVAAAFGAQYRKDERETNPDPLSSRGLGNSSSLGANPSSDEQDITAIFTEVFFPISDNLELTAALRHEDYGSTVGTTTDPKLAMRWDVSDVIGLRASWGTAFQGPAIPQVGRSTASAFIDDPAAFNAVTGKTECLPAGQVGGNNNVTVITQGSDSLRPQSSENFNLGLIFNLTDDLRVSLDYWDFDYTDLISQDEGAQAIVNNDCADGVINDSRIVRDGGGQLREITSEFINTGSVKTNGIDVALDYAYGAFDAGMKLTYINEFEVNNDDGTSFDGVGSRNFTNQFGSLPQLRATANVGWSAENQSANLVLRYIDSYENDQNNNLEIESYTSIDVNYSYDLHLNFEDPLTLKVGARNLFDQDPPSLGLGQRPAYDDRVHDVRGRAMYFEASKAF